MKKVKLLFVIGMFAGGGAEKVLVNMVNQMDLDKYDITIYSVFDTGRKPQLKEGIKIYYSFKVGMNSNNEIKKKTFKSIIANFVFTYGWKLMPMRLFHKLVIKDKYDYEIAYVEGIPHKIVAASTNRSAVKYGWVHIDLSIHKRATQFFLNKRSEIKCYEKMDKLIFVSDYAKDAFINKYGFKDKCITRYNVNENKKICNMALENSDIEKPDNKILMVTVGRLHDQKGYDRLLESVAMLPENMKNFEIWIVGEGDKEKEFIKYINEHNLQDCVKLMGFQNNPYKYISKCDWFIAPSRYEGFSTVVSEAYILGKPVMVTNCSGMSELTENGKYGIVVGNSEAGITDGLMQILKMDKEHYSEYVNKARERGTFFEVTRRLEELCELFE